ncbi:MAG: hypothetical protein F9K18_03910 [Thermoanaerobaculia bacterium]|nr:MAG: hypothetical protein F9K18_03910 [Thermoanaerobaculia bacterium]
MKRGGWRRRLLLAGLFAVLLGTSAWRAGFESSLWMDEVFSLQLARHGPAETVELSRGDHRPPLYHLALRAWLQTAVRLGAEPSLRLARALGLAAWVLLAVSIPLLARGAAGSALVPGLAVAVSGSAHAVQFAIDAGPYALAFPALTLGFLFLTADLLDSRRGSRSGAPWALFAACGLVALWSHLLAWPILGLGCAFWLLARRSLDRQAGIAPELSLGLVAHGVALLGVAPWLATAFRQAEHLTAVRPAWMTEPSARNLARVFVEWLPYGRNGAPPGSARLLWLALGAASAAPALALLLRTFRRRRAGDSGGSRATDVAAWAGILLVASFVLGLWVFRVLEWAFVFHGPRYPGLVAGIWAASLVLAALSPDASGRVRLAGWILLAPWLLTSLVANARAFELDRAGGLAGQRGAVARMANGASAGTYSSPSGLAPFLAHTLARFGSRPVEELPCHLARGESALLLELNRWPELDFPEELLLRYAVSHGELETIESRPLPPETKDFTARLVRASPSAAGRMRAWCSEGIQVPRRDWLAASGARAIAVPERQRGSEGWSYLEFDRALVPYRWSADTEAALRFAAPLPTGTSRLLLIGYREPRPQPTVGLEIAATCGSWRAELALGPGFFEREVELELPARCAGTQALRLRHPLWEAGAAPGEAPRRLGIQLRGAAVSVP